MTEGHEHVSERIVPSDTAPLDTHERLLFAVLLELRALNEKLSVPRWINPDEIKRSAETEHAIERLVHQQLAASKKPLPVPMKGKR